MARIYTRTGDAGTTSLVGGARVPKDSPAIEVGGELDELSALLGIVRAHPLPDGIDELLDTIQQRLLLIGIAIATPPESVGSRTPQVNPEDILALEKHIDALDALVPPLRSFILPGGGIAGATLHLARATARRIERRAVTLDRTMPVAPAIMHWMNRLSDLLFVLARFVNMCQSMPEKDSCGPSWGK